MDEFDLDEWTRVMSADNHKGALTGGPGKSCSSKIPNNVDWSSTAWAFTAEVRWSLAPPSCIGLSICYICLMLPKFVTAEGKWRLSRVYAQAVFVVNAVFFGICHRPPICSFCPLGGRFCGWWCVSWIMFGSPNRVPRGALGGSISIASSIYPSHLNILPKCILA